MLWNGVSGHLPHTCKVDDCSTYKHGVPSSVCSPQGTRFMWCGQGSTTWVSEVTQCTGMPVAVTVCWPEGGERGVLAVILISHSWGCRPLASGARPGWRGEGCCGMVCLATSHTPARWTIAPHISTECRLVYAPHRIPVLCGVVKDPRHVEREKFYIHAYGWHRGHWHLVIRVLGL